MRPKHFVQKDVQRTREDGIQCIIGARDSSVGGFHVGGSHVRAAAKLEMGVWIVGDLRLGVVFLGAWRVMREALYTQACDGPIKHQVEVGELMSAVMIKLQLPHT